MTQAQVGEVRRVEVARHAGFCFGVRRAIRLVEEALASGRGPVTSLGPVIHNPQVVRALEERGLRRAAEPGEIAGGTVVIRSHGAPPRVHAALAARGLRVVDATCPFVKKLHRQARRLRHEGYRVVIVGDRTHSEITSLTEDPDFQGLVVAGPEELDGVRIAGRYGLTAQTTQTHENFQAVAARILPQVLELRIFNTICDSTATRQTEARALASRADAMVVIGGRNSANTRRLAEICRETGTRTVWVETADELSPELVGDAARIGLTAGASTPEWIITEVIRRLESLPAGDAGAGTHLPRGGGISPNRR
ncbi:MAG TPA: 4-hydroxy-3-methylbut-2-enyl diphosphate reductase [Candidatus Methanoperedens sp.]|nr:4-hydroxy-3-methylbut-2-enyl diphosphate reductase [Candidatus Methanoperedens sp.]